MKCHRFIVVGVLCAAWFSCTPNGTGSDQDHGGTSSGTSVEPDPEHEDSAHAPGDDHDHEHPSNDHDDHGHDDHGHDDQAHDGHGHEEGVVYMSDVAIARSGITVGRASLGTVGGGVELPAEIQLNPDRVAHISSLLEGQLLDVYAALGDEIVADHQLAELRSVALGQARAELERASALLDVAEENLERQRRLRDEGITSERSLLEAQLAYDEADAERDAARSRLRVFGASSSGGSDMTITSPIEGVIIERHATRGENIAPSDTLFVVADLDEVWVIGHAYEHQISQISEGMPARVSLGAYPTLSWEGTVDYIGTLVDEETRTLPIRVSVSNADGRLRPGLFGTLTLSAERAKPGCDRAVRGGSDSGQSDGCLCTRRPAGGVSADSSLRRVGSRWIRRGSRRN